MARFQENYRCTSSRNVLCIVLHCLHGETKGENFNDDFSYFTVSRFQTGSTYDDAAIRVPGNLMKEKTAGRES